MSWRDSSSRDAEALAAWHCLQRRPRLGASGATRALDLLAEADRLESIAQLVGAGRCPSASASSLLTRAAPARGRAPAERAQRERRLLRARRSRPRCSTSSSRSTTRCLALARPRRRGRERSRQVGLSDVDRARATRRRPTAPSRGRRRPDRCSPGSEALRMSGGRRSSTRPLAAIRGPARSSSRASTASAGTRWPRSASTPGESAPRRRARRHRRPRGRRGVRGDGGLRLDDVARRVRRDAAADPGRRGLARTRLQRTRRAARRRPADPRRASGARSPGSPINPARARDAARARSSPASRRSTGWPRSCAARSCRSSRSAGCRTSSSPRQIAAQAHAPGDEPFAVVFAAMGITHADAAMVRRGARAARGRAATSRCS